MDRAAERKEIVMAFAEGTTVSAVKSKMEIEELILKRAGRDSEFSSGQAAGIAAIQFCTKNRRVRFTLPLPTEDEAKKLKRRGYNLTPAQRAEWIDGETRRRWRCLLLTIKAKFEVVDTGIETFDEAFLANIVSAGGQTIYERITMMGAEGKLLLGAVEESNVVELATQARRS
jgi:hypothetical protein